MHVHVHADGKNDVRPFIKTSTKKDFILVTVALRHYFSIVLDVAGIFFRRYDLIPHKATVRKTIPLTVNSNNVQSCYGTDTIPTTGPTRKWYVALGQLNSVRLDLFKDCQDAVRGQANLKMVSLYILKQNSDNQTPNQHRSFEFNFHLRATIIVAGHSL